MHIRKEFPLENGKTLIIEVGKLAKQANGSCFVRLDNSIVLATVVATKDQKLDIDFLPLTVDYREKFSASGKIPGGFFKREFRPFDHEILISRLIDRTIRPLFPDEYRADTFVTVELISADSETIPESIVGIAASVALCISDIPFNGPVSIVRVIKVKDEFKVYPFRSELECATLDLTIGATESNIVMVEGEADEASEEDIIEAIKFAHEAIKKQCNFQKELLNEIKIQKRECKILEDDELKNKIYEYCAPKILDVISQNIKVKQVRNSYFDAIINDFISNFSKEKTITPEIEALCKFYYKEVQKEVLKNYYFKNNLRIDGRKFDEIRPITCEVDILPMAHGSALFTRGETQALATVTVGTKLDELFINGVIYQTSERFMLHYNFPPYSTGDAKPYKGIGRREIGHGNLAYRALKRMIPQDPMINPYTIRVVSDILESNGSSSMATVCASTLALMDAGIKIKKPVSGIAMGLIYNNNKTNNYIILTDILGDEDHLGNMDFKICGTKDGITAIQMDIKLEGIPYEIIKEALIKAKEGRLFILNKMLETLPEPRKEVKPHAPKIVKITIPKEHIGAVIGPSGKIIQDIQAETNTTIYIEPTETCGIVEISSNNYNSIEQAIKKIKSIIEDLELVVNEVYDATVKHITDYGAFVEIRPGKVGLLHISEIQWERIRNINDVLKLGQKIKVKLLGFDDQGRMLLSRKVLLPNPFEKNKRNLKE